MRKGKNRRHREARELKKLGGEAASRALGFTEKSDNNENDNQECVECGRFEHADWCRADEPFEE